MSIFFNESFFFGFFILKVALIFVLIHLRVSVLQHNDAMEDSLAAREAELIRLNAELEAKQSAAVAHADEALREIDMRGSISMGDMSKATIRLGLEK